MKKIYRRSISGLMALLICFTTILGGGITAFAASSSGEVAKSYSIGFPRSGDANLDYSGTWGHDELHYMNGWTSGEATWMTTLHTIGSFDGPACYCIEPGVPRLLEKTYTRYGEDYWKNYPSDYNSTIPDHYKNDINGKIIAINPAVLKPEYQRADRQLYLVTGGFGASANARGSAVFCKNLYDGKNTRFERMDVLGEIKPERMPDWAKEKAAAFSRTIQGKDHER